CPAASARLCFVCLQLGCRFSKSFRLDELGPNCGGPWPQDKVQSGILSGLPLPPRRRSSCFLFWVAPGGLEIPLLEGSAWQVPRCSRVQSRYRLKARRPTTDADVTIFLIY